MPKYYTPRKAINFANSGTAAFDGIAQTVEKTALYTLDRQETPAQLGGVIKYRRDNRKNLVSHLDFTKTYFHWSANDVASNGTSFAFTKGLNGTAQYVFTSPYSNWSWFSLDVGANPTTATITLSSPIIAGNTLDVYIQRVFPNGTFASAVINTTFVAGEQEKVIDISFWVLPAGWGYFCYAGYSGTPGRAVSIDIDIKYTRA